MDTDPGRRGLRPLPAKDGVPAFDETYETTGPDGLPVTFGIRYERDPRAALARDRAQALAVAALVREHLDNQAAIAAGTRCPGQPRGIHPPYCANCRNVGEWADYGGGCRCHGETCACAPFHTS